MLMRFRPNKCLCNKVYNGNCNLMKRTEVLFSKGHDNFLSNDVYRIIYHASQNSGQVVSYGCTTDYNCSKNCCE